MDVSRPGSISLLLVTVQFTCLGLLFFTAPVLAKSNLLKLIELLSLLLALWGILSMRRSRLNAFPNVLPRARLVTTGPYRLIRHPMYTALIFLSISLVISYFTYYRLLILLVLVLNLIFKIRYEENLLKKEFSDYKSYAARTWKLIPWIY